MGFLGALFGKKKQNEAARPLADGMRRLPMVRFENAHVSNQSWREIVLDGVRVFDTFGATNLKSGERFIGQHSGIRYVDALAARVAFDALVAQPMSWARTLRTERHVANSKWSGLSTNAVNAEHEAALDGASGAAFDVAARVYADWLVTQNDPRGELAAVQHAGASPAAFVETNAEALFGTLDVSLNAELFDLTWESGLLRGASVRAGVPELERPLAEITSRFLALPIARFVTTLRFGLESQAGHVNDWSAALGAVGDSSRGPFIRELRFDAYSSDESELSWTAFGDCSAHWAKFPRLETLVFRAGGEGRLGAIDLPSLRSFTFESGGMNAAIFESIVRAKWPKLERLEVWTGNGDYGATSTVGQLEVLLNSPPPMLKHLGIANSEFGAQALSLLMASPLFEQLESLDFSKGVLIDEHVELLLGFAPRLARLSSIDLSENLFSDAAVKTLSAALPKAKFDQQRASGQYRYVAVGE